MVIVLGELLKYAQEIDKGEKFTLRAANALIQVLFIQSAFSPIRCKEPNMKTSYRSLNKEISSRATYSSADIVGDVSNGDSG